MISSNTQPPQTDRSFINETTSRSIFRMGLPSMIGFLTLNVYTLVDVFWVGKLGEAHIAAITLFEGIYFLFFAVNEVVDFGALAIISRRYGEADFPRTSSAIRQGFILKIISACIFGLLGVFFIKPLLILIGAEKDVLGLAIKYGRIMLIALCFRFALESIYSILRSIEAPFTAMYIMISGMALNIALDPILIFGWGPLPPLGIVGAAVASIISYFCAVGFGIWWCFSERSPVRIRLRNETPQSNSMLQMIRIGLPVGVVMLSYSLSEFIIIALIANFGTNVIAVYGMGIRLLMIGILSIDGLGRGISPLIGNILGSGLKQRARETAYQSQIFTIGFMFIFAAVQFFFARDISSAFFQDKSTISLGVEMLRIIALALPFFGLIMITDSVFHGAGDNMPPMVIALVSLWGIQIPVIVLTTKYLGFDQTAIWWTWVVAGILEAAVIYFWFLRGKWVTRTV